MTFHGTLYAFQEEAVVRMIERKKLLIGYEMGLGKTVITIAAIERLIEAGDVAGSLIIVPASLKYQWRRQIEHFTGGEARVLVVDGAPKKREMQYRDIMAGEIEYAILNYDQVVNDWEYVSKLPRDCIVTDEATAFKNFRPKRSKRIKRLKADYQFALTGQPIENRAEEVYSIMQWVDPHVLGPHEVFDKTFIVRNSYGGVRLYRNLPFLHELLSEAMVRRTREDVKDQMPEVVEESILVDFDSPGARLYRVIAKDLQAELASVMATTGNFSLFAIYSGQDDSNAARGKIMAKLTCLRMLCDHPDLLRRSAALYDSTAVVGAIGGGLKGGSAYASELAERGLLDGLSKSTKLQAALDLIEEILEAAPENKIVVFSFFKHMITLLQDATAGMAKSVQFTGDMNAKAKDAAKEEFSNDPECRIFLSSDAGGYGVDLPMANYLISYDLPWSAGKWDQRNARIIRLSSEFPEVTLISMLMSGSIEERQYDMLQAKQRISAAIIDGKGADHKGQLKLDLASLTDFLQGSSV